MQAVPTPASNPASQPEVAPISSRRPTDLNLSANGDAPALAALQSAFSNGLVQASDIQKLFNGGMTLGANQAQNQNTIQAAQIQSKAMSDAGSQPPVIPNTPVSTDATGKKGAAIDAALVDRAKGLQGGIATLNSTNPDGTPLSQAQLDSALSQLKPLLTPEEVGKASKALDAAQAAATSTPRLVSILNDPEGAVGRGLGYGGEVTHAFNEGRAGLAGVPVLGSLVNAPAAVKKLNDQQQIQMGISQNISGAISALAGSGNRVMAGEIGNKGFLTRAMPDLNAGNSVWRDYLQDRLGGLKRQVAAVVGNMTPAQAAPYTNLVDELQKQVDLVSTIKNGANEPATAGSQPAVTAAQTPPAAATPPTPQLPTHTIGAKGEAIPLDNGVPAAGANLPIVKTAAERAALPPNSWYLNANGVQQFKAQ